MAEKRNHSSRQLRDLTAYRTNCNVSSEQMNILPCQPSYVVWSAAQTSNSEQLGEACSSSLLIARAVH